MARQPAGLAVLWLEDRRGAGQHLGAVERGTVVPSAVVVSACDAAVLANGWLVSMLLAVIREWAHLRHQHEAARCPGRSTDLVVARARQV